MIVRMTTTSRPQRRDDHRLRDLVQRTGDLTIATDLGVPRSTARGWLAAAPTVVVSVDVADVTEPELRQEILKLRQRVEKLAALLRLALAPLQTSGFSRSCSQQWRCWRAIFRRDGRRWSIRWSRCDTNDASPECWEIRASYD